MKPLTARELEVLRLLCAGRPARGIALDLGLSVETLKDYSYKLRHKLGAKTLPQAAAIAARAGLV